MYLSKVQLNVIDEIADSGATSAAPELVDYLIKQGLIAADLLGYVLTELGTEACMANRADQQKLKTDFSDNVFADRRDKFSQADDIALKKRKPLDPVPTKAKPLKRYKPHD